MNEGNETKVKGFDHLFIVQIWGKVLESTRNILTPELLEFSSKWLTILGHYSILIAAGLALLIGIVGGIRLESFMFFLMALGFAVGILVVQYIAHRFLKAVQKLIENNPSAMSSGAFLDSIGLIAKIGGIKAFLYNMYPAIKRPSLEFLVIGIALFVLLEFIALVALHPKTVNLDVVDKTSAGQEAIGIITFFIKQLMRLVPIVFGIGLVVSAIILLVHFFGLFTQNYGAVATRLSFLKGQDYYQMISVGMIPFTSYIAFVVIYLYIDIVKAILTWLKRGEQ